MAKRAPIGTIRHWQNGTVIKAHDGSKFSAGWIPYSTDNGFHDIGNKCDNLANSLRNKKIPISGEKYLDHEINEFEKPEGKEFGPFHASDFLRVPDYGPLTILKALGSLFDAEIMVFHIADEITENEQKQIDEIKKSLSSLPNASIRIVSAASVIDGIKSFTTSHTLDTGHDAPSSYSFRKTFCQICHEDHCNRYRHSLADFSRMNIYSFSS